MDIWPFSEIRRLKSRISELNAALKQEQAKNTIVKDPAGKECRYAYCSVCSHSIWTMDYRGGPDFFLGCDKATECAEFARELNSRITDP